MQFYFAYLRGRLAVLASDSLLSSLYDVSSGQTVLLAQEGLSAYLAEAILNAYHLHRNRVVLDNNVSNSRTQTNLYLMVLSSYDSGFQVNISITLAEIPSAASCSWAFSASSTMMPEAMIATSLPSFRITPLPISKSEPSP